MSLKKIMSAKLYFFHFFVCLILMMAEAFEITKPGCQATCGNISIPYPFGIGSNCSIGRWAEVKCDTTFNPPKLFFSDSIPDEIVEFRIPNKFNPIRIKHNVSRICFDGSGARTSSMDSLLPVYDNTQFSLSWANYFGVIGCNMFGALNGILRSDYSQGLSIGCRTHCDKTENSGEGKCPSPACCQVQVPTFGTGPYNITVEALNVPGTTDTRCGLAFLSDEDEYRYTASDIQSINYRTMSLFFGVGNQSCEEAGKDPVSFACKGNTECASAGFGYVCSCKDGYEGNPYLDPGCPNLIGGNACNETQKKTCKYKCIKLPGGQFKCTGKPFLQRELKWIILGVGLGLLFLVGGGVWMYYLPSPTLA